MCKILYIIHLWNNTLELKNILPDAVVLFISSPICRIILHDDTWIISHNPILFPEVLEDTEKRFWEHGEVQVHANATSSS